MYNSEILAITLHTQGLSAYQFSADSDQPCTFEKILAPGSGRGVPVTPNNFFSTGQITPRFWPVSYLYVYSIPRKFQLDQSKSIF